MENSKCRVMRNKNVHRRAIQVQSTVLAKQTGLYQNHNIVHRETKIDIASMHEKLTPYSLNFTRKIIKSDL